MIALLVMTDGRDEYLDRCVGQPTDNLPGFESLITEWWMHDDTGDDAYRSALAARYPDFTQLHEGGRRGFGGAIRHAWETLRLESKADFVLHLEADFLFTREVDLAAMLEVLQARPYLAQMALRRQPWNDQERAAGGVVEANPDAFTEVADGRHVWLEHRAFFTTNPSLYRRSLCDFGWPSRPRSEGLFAHALWASDPDLRAGYWGARDSGEWVEHIGQERVGSGY